MVRTMGKPAVENASGANIAATNGATPHRWRLNRAGIINVYQYENEVLEFAGGRLLLRGVNGSGKSTAMNMLLPFLLTARPGRIDAAGEQTGILKSWMLDGRDDPQPVGYLWIEFQRRGEFLVCGCGIKANRQSDSVSTWWFVTSKRPGLDVHLVVDDQPLSAEGLRAALDGDEVFGDRRRSDYRLAVRQRLFGGVPIDQHIGLIHVVRSPRVGDRIDVELPEHLVEALPQLSDQALAEAAQPLDDLEEHRRNVADLERTSQAIEGLLEVYRVYCADELRQRTAEGRSRLSSERSRSRDEKQKQRAAEATEAEVVRLDEAIDRQERTATRLRSEISALRRVAGLSRGPGARRAARLRGKPGQAPRERRRPGGSARGPPGGGYRGTAAGPGARPQRRRRTQRRARRRSRTERALPGRSPPARSDQPHRGGSRRCRRVRAGRHVRQLDDAARDQCDERGGPSTASGHRRSR